MSTKYQSVLLFGPPGVGKGTQGKCLSVIPGFHHLACGDAFRALDRSSALGKEFMKHSTRGELVPDDLTIAMWQDNVRSRLADGRFKPGDEILVLDGIPRNVAQARALDASIDVRRIIHLVCADESEMVQRMKRRAIKEGRPDDADERVIRNRFAVYHKETAPVLAHYPRSLLVNVDAMGAPVRVLQRILDALAPIQAADHPRVA